MTYTAFTAEQLAQVASADMQQSVALRHWLRDARYRGCQQRKLSLVLTCSRDSYRLCRDCDARLERSVDEGSGQQCGCADMRGHRT